MAYVYERPRWARRDLALQLTGISENRLIGLVNEGHVRARKMDGKALGLGGSNRVKMPKKGESTPEEIKAAKSHNAQAKKDWKNKLKGEAQRRFPSADVTLDTADALLILDYARAKEGGK